MTFGTDSVQKWRLKLMRKLLIVVDYQKDFVDGSLANPHTKALEDVIGDMIREYEKEGDDVIFTMDTHQKDYLDTEEGRHLPIPHCLEGSNGHRLYGKIEELSMGHPIFKKETFPSLALAKFLEGKTYSEVTLIGVVTNICVISNAIMVKAALPNAHIVIDAKGCASNDERLEQECYDVCSALQIEVKNR